MTVRKVVAGSVLAAGLGVAGVFGAATASAGPGISFDPGTGGTKTIGIGDQSATGAKAIATNSNGALAISLGAPAHATATGSATTALAVGVIAPANAGAVGHFNSAVTVLGGDSFAGGKSNNHVFAAGSQVLVDEGKDNQVVNVLGYSQSQGSGNFSVSLCGGSGQVNLSGQGVVNSGHIPPALGGVC